MEFTAFEKTAIEALDDCKGNVKHCSKNALQHLEKAWLIREIDLEMCVFRGITAEEEAASALFHCLKNHRYKNANKLLFNKHTYKLGLHPFIKGIGGFLDDIIEQDTSPFGKHYLKHTEQSGRKAIELIIELKNEKVHARPVPPLHFTFSQEDTGEVCTFEHNFQELIKGEKYKDALQYVIDKAQTRNKILYANNIGKPKVEGDLEGYLNSQKKKVMTFLIIMLMIDPWEKEEGNSLFVQQGLDSFLLLLNRINSEDVYQPRHNSHTK